MIDCEQLESRRMMSANPVLQLNSKGTLVVKGTDLADSITISIPANKITNGYLAVVKNRRGTFQFHAKITPVKSISVDAGLGSDSILIQGGNLMTVPETLLGGDGNDRINYSAVGAIRADGGNGNDTVGATATIAVTSTNDNDVINAVFAKKNSTGRNTVFGGLGNDILSGDTNDIVDGGDGIDLAVLGIVGDSTVTAARRNNLALLYYTRLGTKHIEKTIGASLLGSTG